MDFCLVRDNLGDLLCRDICPSSFHLKCIGMKKKDVGTFKDNEKNPHNIASTHLKDHLKTSSILSDRN